MSNILDCTKQVPINALITKEFSNPGAVVSSNNIKELDEHNALLEKIRIFLENREQKSTQMATSKAVTELKALEELAEESVAVNQKLLAQMKSPFLICISLFNSLPCIIWLLTNLIYDESQVPTILSFELKLFTVGVLFITAIIVLDCAINIVSHIRKYPKVELFHRKQESPIPTLEFIKRKQSLLKCLRDEVYPMRIEITALEYNDMQVLLLSYLGLYLHSISRVFDSYCNLWSIETIFELVCYSNIGLGSAVLVVYAGHRIYRYKNRTQ